MPVKVQLTPEGKKFLNDGGFEAETNLKTSPLAANRISEEANRIAKQSKNISIIAIIISLIAIAFQIFS